jgi:hypothetical protein
MEMMTGGVSFENPNGTEFFYWTPDMPILPWAQAYQMYLYYKNNIDDQKFLFCSNDSSSEKKIKNQKQTDLTRLVIYHKTWDNRFQTDKMFSLLSEDMYPWFFTLPELQIHKDAYMHNLTQVSDAMDSKFLSPLTLVKNNYVRIPISYMSKFYYLGDL